MAIGTFEEFQEFQVVAKSAEEGRLKEALNFALKTLEKDPNHGQGLTLASYCLRRLGALVQAYQFAKNGVREFPEEAALWVNLGGAAQGLWLQDEAESAYRKALSLLKNPKHIEIVYLNLGALAIDCGDFEEGEKWIRKLLELRPNDKNTLGNLGFCYLARREWKEGWRLYAKCVGSDWLPKVQYADEPEWDGEPGKTIAIYEDQGVGDAVSFASVLPDAAKDCKKIILDCEPKLHGLFQRSFPQVKCYPTRRETGSSGTLWDKADRSIDASIPLSQLGQFYRLTDESFPGTAYLKACPVRSGMWGAYFRTLKRPVIGIAWTGGVAHTNARFRALALEQLLPVFHTIPQAHWVSLQYKDASKDIAEFHGKHPRVDLAQYRFGTLTSDYDDTAAMVSQMDYVVCIQTAVGHLAGALGKPVTVMIPEHTTWRYAAGETIPWYKSMTVVRQEGNDWNSAIDRVCELLAAHFGSVSTRAGEDASNGPQLREDGAKVRANGRGDHLQTRGHAPP